MVEAFSTITFRQGFPIYLCSLKQGKSTHYVGLSKGERIFNTSVHMAFRCQVNNSINMILLEDFQHFIKVTDISLYKGIIRLILDIFQVSQITGISQFIQIDNMIFRIFIDEQTYNVRSDEACSTCNQYISCKIHVYFNNQIVVSIHVYISAESLSNKEL